MNRKQAIEHVRNGHVLQPGLRIEIIRALSGLGDEETLARELESVAVTAYPPKGETLLRVVREHVCRALDAPGIFDERDQLREALDASRKYNAELNETISMIGEARDKHARQSDAERKRADECLRALDELRKDLNRVTSHRNAIESDREKVGRKLYDTTCELDVVREQRNRLDARVRELVTSNEVLCKDFDAMKRERDTARGELAKVEAARAVELATERARQQVDHAMRTPVGHTSHRPPFKETAQDFAPLYTVRLSGIDRETGVDWRAALERERGFHKVTQDRASQRLVALEKECAAHEGTRILLSNTRASLELECEAHEKTRGELAKERAEWASMYKTLTDTCAKLEATREENAKLHRWSKQDAMRPPCAECALLTESLRGERAAHAETRRERDQARRFAGADALAECDRLRRARDEIAANLNLKCKLLADERLNHGFTRGELDNVRKDREHLAREFNAAAGVVNAARKLVEREQAYDSAFAALAGELDKVGE